MDTSAQRHNGRLGQPSEYLALADGLTGLRVVRDRLQGVSKSRSPWWEGVARHLVRPIAAEWPQPKVQRSVASQDDEWQVSTAAVIGLQNLTGCSQP